MRSTRGGLTLCDRFRQALVAAARSLVFGAPALRPFLYARAAERLNRIGPRRV